MFRKLSRGATSLFGLIGCAFDIKKVHIVVHNTKMLLIQASDTN